MKIRWFSKLCKAAKYIAAGLVFASSISVHAADKANVPTWLREAAAVPLPSYSAETDAVKLLDEQITTIASTGEVTTFNRVAYKILRPDGKDLGNVHVAFTPETKVNFIRGWSISSSGMEYQLNDKDAVETNWGNDAADYSDVRYKVLVLPGREVGSIIGYEYEQRERPHFHQDTWFFQSIYPVVKSRYTIRMPAGWEYKDTWTNHVSLAPTRAGDNITWELQNVSPIEHEDDMPSLRSIAGRMVISYYPASTSTIQTLATWSALGRWYQSLSADRLTASPDIKTRIAALTAGITDSWAKMRALSAFAQRDVRYVAVEIGIGGWQPHAASDVFKNRFGDCKDKATLLNTMLKEIGVDAYYVVINTERGIVRDEIPEVTSFNHVISAIKLPTGVPIDDNEPVIDHPKLGKLLLFDPTSEMVPLGQLPYYLQANKGLLVTPDGGELISIPLLKPDTNRLVRVANLELTPDGTLIGDVQELRSGYYAAETRARLLSEQLMDRAQVLDRFLASFLGQFKLEKASVANLTTYDKDLVLMYRFEAPGYAKVAGNLLLVRPRVLGDKSEGEFERKRKYPVEFRHAGYHADTFTIKVPPGYKLDELPDPVTLSNDIVDYDSKVQLAGNVLTYKRSYRIKNVFIPLTRFEEMKSFYRQVATDERNSAVLRKDAQ